MLDITGFEGSLFFHNAPLQGVPMNYNPRRFSTNIAPPGGEGEGVC